MPITCFSKRMACEKLKKLLKGFDVNDLEELARVGGEARAMMLETPFPKEVEAAIFEAYKRLGERHRKENLRSRGAFFRDRRRSARRIVCRPAGHDPQRARRSND